MTDRVAADSPDPQAQEPTASELCVLALLVERPSHGWSLAASLAHDGEIGAIWSVARPLVYTGLRRLEDAGYVRMASLERGRRGPHRVVYAPTARGRKVVRTWLAQPVEHVRDIRSLFLAKVVLTQRLGLDTEPLLVAQRAILAPFLAYLEARLDEVDPVADPTEATVLWFRLATAETTIAFIDRMLDVRRPGARPRKARSSS